MKYFIDTEFIEGFHKPLFGKKRHFIDLISIGIVCEDGREYYAISNEFNPKDADKWVNENIIDKLPSKYFNGFNATEARQWKSNHQIRQEIKQFFGYKAEWTDYGSDEFTDDKDIQVYAYYADYDWVLFCSLFGRMIDLPHGMPMYCKDLKQVLDEKVNNLSKEDFLELFHKDNVSFEEKLNIVKNRLDYPKQENEHDALDDAKWNFNLYKFLQKL